MKFREIAGAFIAILLSAVSSLGVFVFTWGSVKTTIAEHERRILVVESQKADTLPSLISDQGRQITTLAEIVRQDHDSIVKLAVIVEERERKK